jgi:hypothetical protein
MAEITAKMVFSYMQLIDPRGAYAVTAGAPEKLRSDGSQYRRERKA